MKAIAKLGIIALFCLYAGCAFAIVSPLITLITNESTFAIIGVLFVVLLAFFASYCSYLLPFAWTGIFHQMNDDIEAPKWWMRLHSTFIFATTIFFLIGFFAVFFPMANTDYGIAFAIEFMLTGVTIFFSIVAMWSINRLIGMGYKWFLKGEFLGIISFSSRASSLFNDENPKGIWYLLSALLMFQDHLKRHRLENEQLSNTISKLRSIYVFRFQIPYEQLKDLAFATARLPSIESFDAALATFNSSQNMKWSSNFKSINSKKRPPIEWIAAIAGLIAALTFLPESTRTFALSYLSSWSASNIFLIIGFCFFFVVGVIFLLDREYRTNPLSDYATRAFGKNAEKDIAS